MYQFLRRRRTWIGLLAISAFVLFYHSSPRSPAPSSSQETVIRDHPYATQHFLELYSSEPPAHKHSVTWSTYEEIPQSRVFAHIPGFTVLENVYSVNGTIFLVNDNKNRIPHLENVLSAWAEVPGGQVLYGLPTDSHIRLVTRMGGTRIFGHSARELRGTTWIYNNPIAYTDESFSLEFLRTHFMQEHRTRFNESLIPPSRVLFPRISNKNRDRIPGLSSIPRLLFPSTIVGFEEDCNDYASTHRPIIYQTVVLLDRAAAARNPTLASDTGHAKLNLEVISPLVGFRAIDGGWWSPWRGKMLEMLGGIDALRSNVYNYAFAQPVITYVVSQHEESGGFLNDEQHELLIQALHQLAKDREYEVNIINPRDISFIDRVKTMLRTTILMGASGPFLDNVMWMHPTYASLMIEFFPENYLSSKQYHVAKSVGIEYMAWRGTQQIPSPGSAPPPSTSLKDLKEALRTPTFVDATPLIQLLVDRLEKDQGDEVDDMRK